MAGIVYFTTVTHGGRARQPDEGRRACYSSRRRCTMWRATYSATWLSRAAGLDKNAARSVAFEVGLQNGGMASGLAGAMGKLGTVGLAAAIFQSLDERERLGAGELLAQETGEGGVTNSSHLGRTYWARATEWQTRPAASRRTAPESAGAIRVRLAPPRCGLEH
jgi:hypothetical protein